MDLSVLGAIVHITHRQRMDVAVTLRVKAMLCLVGQETLWGPLEMKEREQFAVRF